VRLDDGDVISNIPRVCLTAVDANVSQCATNMLDDRITGWQWVEGVLNFTTLSLIPISVQVELYADRRGASRSSGEVFFDNVCVEPMLAAIVGTYVCRCINLLIMYYNINCYKVVIIGNCHQKLLH